MSALRNEIAQRARVVVANEHAEGDIGRKADEPQVLGLVGGARLAGQVLAQFADARAGRVPRWMTPSMIEVI